MCSFAEWSSSIDMSFSSFVHLVHELSVLLGLEAVSQSVSIWLLYDLV